MPLVQKGYSDKQELLPVVEGGDVVVIVAVAVVVDGDGVALSSAVMSFVSMGDRILVGVFFVLSCRSEPLSLAPSKQSVKLGTGQKKVSLPSALVKVRSRGVLYKLYSIAFVAISSRAW